MACKEATEKTRYRLTVRFDLRDRLSNISGEKYDSYFFFSVNILFFNSIRVEWTEFKVLKDRFLSQNDVRLL